ncbi:TolB family protein [Maribellus mangrovi]|uniref:TolB family protein n=1 Tax=Maribellus mangrovi TaxID=3133146 RepID=UPI0030EE14F4
MYRFIYIFVLALTVVFTSCSKQVKPDMKADEQPEIFPDYREVTVPANIAPLNFRMKEQADGIAVSIKGTAGGEIHVKGKTHAEFPAGKWSDLLTENTGQELTVTVTAKVNDKWVEYAPFKIHISADPIDYGLAYRLIAPGYEVWSKMGIYQRQLASYDQDAIIENTLITGSCVNCHSFRLTDPDDMSLHIRGKKGGTILATDGDVKILNTKTPKTISNFVYPFWHPRGDYVAYSVNNIRQVFHETKDKRVEVIDSKSDIIVYDVKNNETLYSDKIMTDDHFETFPSFSPDGKTLYFCSAAAKQMPMQYKDVRYNLCSIAFDSETGTFGDKIDTLFNAAAIEKSITFPRPSPDGKYIMFTLVDYGNFSIWHPEADLYLYDVARGETHPLDEANSNDTESYHSWSSNSRWFVFSSRRINGLYTRPFIAHLDENGNCGKPFLLPQKNPNYYDELLYSYNIPEFINKKVELDVRTVEHLANTKGTNVKQRE